jgi:EpsI family protein
MKALLVMNLKGGIKSFPLAFSDWTGQASFVDQEMIDKSGAEDAFNGSYRNIKGDAISLYIGYRATAFLANENFFHSPTVCLPSSGWETLSTSTRVITNVPFWGQLKVTRMIVSNLGDRLLVYFWFQTKNKSSYDKNINRLDLALHAIRRDNTYDLFIRMITQIHPNEPIEASEQRMDAFVRDMTIAMQRYIRENQIINSVNVK